MGVHPQGVMHVSNYRQETRAMPTYRKTPGNRDVPIEDGTELVSVEPLGEEFYDRDEVGPMYQVEPANFDGLLHLFADEIDGLDYDFDEIAEQQGWSQHTMLLVARDFIAREGANERLGEYAAGVAAEVDHSEKGDRA